MPLGTLGTLQAEAEAHNATSSLGILGIPRALPQRGSRPAQGFPCMALSGRAKGDPKGGKEKSCGILELRNSGAAAWVGQELPVLLGHPQSSRLSWTRLCRKDPIWILRGICIWSSVPEGCWKLCREAGVLFLPIRWIWERQCPRSRQMALTHLAAPWKQPSLLHSLSRTFPPSAFGGPGPEKHIWRLSKALASVWNCLCRE